MFRFASPLFLSLLVVFCLVIFFKFRKKNTSIIKVSSLKDLDTLFPSFMVMVSKFIPVLKIISMIL